MPPNQPQELEPVAEAPNLESNQLNSTIAALNVKLGVRNVGIEVWLFPDEDHVQIGYAKADETWQLATPALRGDQITVRSPRARVS